jgi:hypothetical protein
LKLSENRFNVYPSLKGKQTGQTISFEELVKKIKSPNQVIALAREHGKGSLQYDELKLNNLEFIYPNLWSHTNLNNPKYSYGTGYVYLDIDLASKEEAIKYRNELTNIHPYIYACWLSLSEKGLGILVKVENGGQYYFEQYWRKLNDLIKEVDASTKNYNRKCIISHDPSIYVNKDVCSLDSIFKFESNSVKYCTQIPVLEFDNINTPVIYPEGKEVLEINLFKYKKSKIANGYRNKTIGRIGSMLIALNPDADYHQLLNALLSINKNYCTTPLTDKEVINSLKANIKKYNEGTLDFSGYYTTKRIFWHPECRLNRKERISTGRTLLSEARLKQREELILDTIQVLRKKSLPTTINRISEFTTIKKSTLYITVSKSKKVQNELHFFQLDQYNPIGYNMSQMEKVQMEVRLVNRFLENPHNIGDVKNNSTLSHQCIYEALEDLQDNMTKITQRRVANHTGLSLRTVKTYWTESFKDLVKEYNDSLKRSKRKPKRSNGDVTIAATRAIVALQDTVVTKESIVEYSGLSIEEVNQHWTDGLQELVDRVNSNEDKSGVIIGAPTVKDDYMTAGCNILNPLTDERKFDEFAEQLRKSKLWLSPNEISYDNELHEYITGSA